MPFLKLDDPSVLSTEELAVRTHSMLEELYSLAAGGEVSDQTSGYDVWIIAGQSNATSFAADEEIDARLDWNHPRIWQWPTPHTDVATAYRNKLIPAVDPLLFPPNFLSGDIKVSPGTAFARELLPYTAANRDIVLIPGAVPGVGLLEGAWLYPNGELFLATKAAAVACINTLRAEGKDARLKGIIWVQGENEAANLTKLPANYQTQVIITLNALRDEVPYSDGAIVLIGQMNPDWIDSNAASPTHQTYAIDAVHRLLPDLMERCWFVHGPRDSIATGDVIHYGIAGQRTFGKRMLMKARSAAMRGQGLTAPSIHSVGPTLFITVPESDAPLFFIRHRPASSTGSYTEIVFSPTEHYEPGDEVPYTFSGLSGDLELQVAGRMAGQNGPFSASITLKWEAVPTALTRPNLAAAAVTGNLVNSVPSIGTNTTAWLGPSGKEPALVTYRNVPVVQTDVANSLLTCTASIPNGSYTKMIVAKQRSFDGDGTYMTASEGYIDHLLRRTAPNIKTAVAIYGGGTALTTTAEIPDADWFVLFERYDQAAPSNQLSLILVTKDSVSIVRTNAGARNLQTGLLLNSVTTTGQNGNQAYYADWPVWSSALTDAQAIQEARLAFKGLRYQD